MFRFQENIFDPFERSVSWVISKDRNIIIRKKIHTWHRSCERCEAIFQTLYVRTKISRKTLFQILCEKASREPRVPIWNRLLTLTSMKDLRDSTASYGFRSYTACLKSSRGANTMNDVNIEKKCFEAFTHTARELINVAFMFHIVDGIAKSPTCHEILLFRWNDRRNFDRWIIFIMRYMQIFSPICDEKARIKRDMMYVY